MIDGAVLPWIVNRWLGESGLVVEVADGTLSWEAGVSRLNRWLGESGLVVEVADGTLSWEAGVSRLDR